MLSTVALPRYHFSHERSAFTGRRQKGWMTFMRSQFLLIPAALVMAAPASAKIFMDVEQAQRLMFPGKKLTEHFVKLDQDQFNAIINDSNVNVDSRNIKAWRTEDGEWFVLDQVRGKDDWITYAVGIDAKGAVRRIEVLECLDDYNGITIPAWRAQFYGKRRGASFENIERISGATLSCSQITGGVKRVLSTLALVLQDTRG